jgi:hypothetical protein
MSNEPLLDNETASLNPKDYKNCYPYYSIKSMRDADWGEGLSAFRQSLNEEEECFMDPLDDELDSHFQLSRHHQKKLEEEY